MGIGKQQGGGHHLQDQLLIAVGPAQLFVGAAQKHFVFQKRRQRLQIPALVVIEIGAMLDIKQPHPVQPGLAVGNDGGDSGEANRFVAQGQRLDSPGQRAVVGDGDPVLMDW